MIGDVLLECELEPGEKRLLAGFENHAGRTRPRRRRRAARPRGRGVRERRRERLRGLPRRPRGRHVPPRAAPPAKPVVRRLAPGAGARAPAAASRRRSSRSRTSSRPRPRRSPRGARGRAAAATEPHRRGPPAFDPSAEMRACGARFVPLRAPRVRRGRRWGRRAASARGSAGSAGAAASPASSSTSNRRWLADGRVLRGRRARASARRGGPRRRCGRRASSAQPAGRDRLGERDGALERQVVVEADLLRELALQRLDERLARAHPSAGQQPVLAAGLLVAARAECGSRAAGSRRLGCAAPSRHVVLTIRSRARRARVAGSSSTSSELELGNGQHDELRDPRRPARRRTCSPRRCSAARRGSRRGSPESMRPGELTTRDPVARGEARARLDEPGVALRDRDGEPGRRRRPAPPARARRARRPRDRGRRRRRRRARAARPPGGGARSGARSRLARLRGRRVRLRDEIGREAAAARARGRRARTSTPSARSTRSSIGAPSSYSSASIPPLRVRDEQPHRLEAVGEALGDPRPQLLEPLAGRARRSAGRPGSGSRPAPAAKRVDEVDLVEDELDGKLVGADLGQHAVDGGDRLLQPVVVRGGVDDVEDEVGEQRLLERGGEALDQLVRAGAG